MNESIERVGVMENHTGFEAVAPEQLGITSASLINLIETAAARDLCLHSLMVIRHGKVAAQMWWKPYSPEKPHHLYSFSKSITCTAVGFAISEGLLSLDDRVVKFYPRRVENLLDKRVYSMTIEHLLTMTSGAFIANEAMMNIHIDWAEWFLNSPLTYFPGEKFIYNSLNTYMLSNIIRRVTGMGLVDYLTPRLFEPLGIKRPQWYTCPMGIECGGWGLELTTEDMAKFTLLYLNDGVWNGKRILPEGWARLVGEKHADSSTDAKFAYRPDSTAGYGYQFWINRDGKSYRADGMYAQYGLVLPEKDAVNSRLS